MKETKEEIVKAATSKENNALKMRIAALQNEINELRAQNEKRKILGVDFSTLIRGLKKSF